MRSKEVMELLEISFSSKKRWERRGLEFAGLKKR